MSKKEPELTEEQAERLLCSALAAGSKSDMPEDIPPDLLDRLHQKTPELFVEKRKREILRFLCNQPYSAVTILGELKRTSAYFKETTQEEIDLMLMHLSGMGYIILGKDQVNWEWVYSTTSHGVDYLKQGVVE